MVNKQIRKSAMSLTSLTLGIIIVITIFTAMYGWLGVNADNAEITLDAKYGDTQANLTATQTALEQNIDDIKEDIAAVKEAESGFLTAWNGLKGLGNVLRLPLSLLTTGLQTWTSIDYSLDFIPGYMKALILIALTALIVFIVLAKLMGDTNL